ncbi:hypothetical protein [Streptomyces violascens]|uniref:hypothetical protein n=1 Tax=Streptomyces violascens TaxID=67381 RepID=UPI00364E7667
MVPAGREADGVSAVAAGEVEYPQRFAAQVVKVTEQVCLGDRVAQSASGSVLPLLPGGHRGVELLKIFSHLATIAA